MITIEHVKNEIEILYGKNKTLISNFDVETLKHNPILLQVNIDIIISNCNIIKNLMSLYIGLEQQKSSQFKIK